VYGLARPSGACDRDSLSALADALAADPAPLTAVLSPLAPGPALAELLRRRGPTPAGERPICIAELGDGDPAARFHRRAQRAIRTAVARGASVAVDRLQPWFGPFYRAAMAELSAEPAYFFADGYFNALAALPHFQVTVSDEHGVAGAALFLYDAREAYYHLGGRRCGRPAVVGAMSLVLAEGIRESAARGCALAILGGGRSDDPGDPCCSRLASRLAEYVGDVRCVPVGNCTLGLMAALRIACGVPSGTRNLIAVPAFTFTATACAIRWAGFEPLFIDIDAESWQMDPLRLGEALELYDGSVAGIMGCSTFGTAAPPALRAGWRALAASSDLPLLIDSAAGFGAVDEYGAPLGAQGETEIFSFHATKPFSIGEGGAIVTSDPEFGERAARLINFGINPDTRSSEVAGLNAKMSELIAAAGLAMLDRFDVALARRRATAAEIQARFACHPLTYQAGSAGSTWQVFQLLVPDARARRRALALAEELAVEARTCFDPPLHHHPAFADAPVAGSLDVTEALAARALSLPMANALGPRQIARLGDLVDRVFEDRSC
jgi:dTDP-4-amino-4,6-dideoxygalactose transaminase